MQEAPKYKVNRSGLADVDANLFRAAHVCVSNEEVRSYINGVRIERHPDGGVLLVATDGHRLVAVRDETGWCKTSISVRLPRPGLEACKPRKRMPVEPTRLVVDRAGVARVGDLFISPGDARIKGDYPDWRRIVPVKNWKFATASFNAAYIADFGKVAEMLGSPNRCIRMLVDSKADPALVLFPHNNEAFGVLMPMLANVAGAGLPLWMKPVMKGVKSALLKSEAT